MTTDQKPTEQQAPEAEANAPAQPEQVLFDPEMHVEKTRFTGAIQKIQTLTEEKAGFEGQLGEKTSQIERLSRQLAELEAGNQATLGQRETTIQELTQQVQELSTGLKQREIDLKKVEIANEIGAPELISILGTIPSVEDPEALKNIMTNIAGFADSKVKQREKELLSGETPGVTAVENASNYPDAGDDRGWNNYLAKLNPYSEEYNKALEAWGQQLHK